MSKKYYCSNEDLKWLVDFLVIEKGFKPKDIYEWFKEVEKKNRTAIINGGCDNFSDLNPFPCNVIDFLGEELQREIRCRFFNNPEFDAIRDYIVNSRSFKIRVNNILKQLNKEN